MMNRLVCVCASSGTTPYFCNCRSRNNPPRFGALQESERVRGLETAYKVALIDVVPIRATRHASLSPSSVAFSLFFSPSRSGLSKCRCRRLRRSRDYCGGECGKKIAVVDDDDDDEEEDEDEEEPFERATTCNVMRRNGVKEINRRAPCG